MYEKQRAPQHPNIRAYGFRPRCWGVRRQTVYWAWCGGGVDLVLLAVGGETGGSVVELFVVAVLFVVVVLVSLDSLVGLLLLGVVVISTGN